MLPKHGPPTHPGEILLEEYLKPLGLRQTALAAKMGVSVQRINQIINGKRGVSAQTAVLLGRVLDTDPWFWMELQAQYDLWFAMREAENATQATNRPATTTFFAASFGAAPETLGTGVASVNYLSSYASDPPQLHGFNAATFANAHGRMAVYVDESPSVLSVPALPANDITRHSFGVAHA